MALLKNICAIVNMLPVEYLFIQRLSLKAKFETVNKGQNWINQNLNLLFLITVREEKRGWGQGPQNIFPPLLS